MEKADILNKTRELGELIQNSDEMKAYKLAEVRQQEDAVSQEAMKEFNLNRINLARDMQNGKISREAAIEANNEAYDKLIEKAPLIKEYVEKKQEFDALVNQVNQIINYYITGSTGECTHDCSTCGVCH